MPLSPEQRIALRQRLYPAADRQTFGIVEEALQRHLQPRTVVLDAGTGAGTWVLRRFARRIAMLVGVDVTLPPTAGRIALPALADLAALPFEASSFDLILCHDVIEHLPDPPRVFSEFARVLAPQGVLIFQTPALAGPVMLLSRLAPVSLHRGLKARLGSHAEDVFPTYYRCNTPRQLDRALAAAGFTRESLVTVDQTYDYLYFSRLTYTFGLLYSRLVARSGFGWLRNVIIGVYRKWLP